MKIMTATEIEKMKESLLKKKKRLSIEKRGKKRPHNKILSHEQKDKYRIKMASRGELALRPFTWLRFKDIKAAYNTVSVMVANEVVLNYLIQVKYLRVTEGEETWTGSGLSLRKVPGRKRYYVQQNKQEEFIEFIRTYFVDEKYDGFNKIRQKNKE